MGFYRIVYKLKVAILLICLHFSVTWQ